MEEKLLSVSLEVWYWNQCWLLEAAAVFSLKISLSLSGSPFGSRWRPLNWLTHRAFQSSGCLDERAQRKNLEESSRLRQKGRVKATDRRLLYVQVLAYWKYWPGSYICSFYIDFPPTVRIHRVFITASADVRMCVDLGWLFSLVPAE